MFRAAVASVLVFVSAVIASAQTAPQIEDSFRETLALLEAHLAPRPYLMGARPAFADFGLWPQIYEAWTDPTAGALVEVMCVSDWPIRA